MTETATASFLVFVFVLVLSFVLVLVLVLAAGYAMYVVLARSRSLGYCMRWPGRFVDLPILPMEREEPRDVVMVVV